MAGKSRQQKKRQAKTRKQLNDELRRKQLVQKKVRASKPRDMANNNAEPSPPSAETVNEDAQKDAEMMAKAEAEELELAKEQFESEQEALEPTPFDPQEAMARLLKKNGT